MAEYRQKKTVKAVKLANSLHSLGQINEAVDAIKTVKVETKIDGSDLKVKLVCGESEVIMTAGQVLVADVEAQTVEVLEEAEFNKTYERVIKRKSRAKKPVDAEVVPAQDKSVAVAEKPKTTKEVVEAKKAKKK